MVKIGLQISARFENITELWTNHPNHTFNLKLKCLNCGNSSEKWHGVTESETFPTKTGKSEVHYFEKCKLCGRENSLSIVEGSNGIYPLNETMSGDLFKTIVEFDCRGIEPIDYQPSESGWFAKVVESNNVFDDVDLSEKEWNEYDVKLKDAVGIYDLKSRFVKV